MSNLKKLFAVGHLRLLGILKHFKFCAFQSNSRW